MDSRAWVDRIWYGADPVASAVRTALIPAERLFGGIVGARDILYDAGWLPAAETPIPAVSIGNLSVGGTGKTPMAAWIARQLVVRGAKPAIVLRGYGSDEPLVHQTLNPDVAVVVDGDRVTGVIKAANAGADIAVLDDAFQHRRVQRIADVVLVSADQWSGDVRLLPAGPWREPLEAAKRATLVVVTRKAASEAVVDDVHDHLSRVARAVPRVSVRFVLSGLVRADQPERSAKETRSLESLRGASVHAVLSIADPRAFITQLSAGGATVRPHVFPDHHAFSASDIAHIAGGLRSDDTVVCTLKDAVKLAPSWPRLGPPLWYVSQQVMVERGVGGLERLVEDLVRVRSRTSPTAG
jgi:tetraacyldisaccharide 4'-kinase